MFCAPSRPKVEAKTKNTTTCRVSQPIACSTCNYIIKSLGISQLVHSFTNTCIPRGLIKDKLLKFLWINRKDKVRREGMTLNYDKGGLRMVDIIN